MRRSLVFCLAIFGSCSEPEPPGAAESGLRALVRMQNADGSWTSRIYPDLKQGPALTALALFTLSRFPDKDREPHAASVDRAVKYLLQKLTPEGSVGMEYPNFTTAFTLQSILVLKPPAWESSAERMAVFLWRGQCVDENGWKPSEPGFGGWGLGAMPPGKKELIRLDVSTCRHVLEALDASGHIGRVKDQARNFVLACRNDHGGFCYSRANTHQNKAEADPAAKTGFRSYGTATADGLLALRALGEKDFASTLGWLEKNFSVDATPGFKELPQSPWEKGLLYYYLYSVSSALDRCRSTIPWKPRVLDKLRSLQAPDGSWINPSSAMKEDEPVVATCFALLAWRSASEK
jgi:hypothetical protein